HKAKPIFFGSLLAGRDDFYLVAILQVMAQWYQFMVHLGSNTAGSEIGVYFEGKVERSRVVGQLDKCPLGREDENLIRKEVHLEIVEEIHCIGLRIAEYLAYLLYPLVQPAVRIGLLVLPMG